MTYVADLHLHSAYAMATSKELNFENMAKWAKIKGIDLLASADFTHPVWFEESRKKLKEVGNGLYEFDGVQFILGTEVNCNGYQDGRNRRIHVLIFAPSLDTVERINKALASKGILHQDGRPTLHMTPRVLLTILLEIDENIILIPAHAWTPWFGIFGSKSGFDSLHQAFGDMANHIYAIETGLSSDPAMNWGVPELDNISIVSFSDAHSLPKMARELTVMNGDLSYSGLVESLKTQNIAYTIEFFPEEGKYHYSGHRKCSTSLSPQEIAGNGPLCPVCGRKMTLGVMQRADELSTRAVKTWTDADGFTRADNNRPPYKSMVSLQEIIAESLGRGVNTKGVQATYFNLTSHFGNELAVLMDAPTADIANASSERIAEGIARVRKGNIFIEPGYDGLFGKVSVWPDETTSSQAQMKMET